jgi:hypothetical protein
VRKIQRRSQKTQTNNENKKEYYYILGATMKLEELKLTITRIEDFIDKDGNYCLKCKGYNAYKTQIKGKKANAFNFFTNIRLYPISQEQYDETKNRLFNQTVDKPKLKVIAYENELTTHLIGGKICCVLTVNRYDFEKDKLFRKNKLINYKGE